MPDMDELARRTLRVGVIGAGAWARAAHVPGFEVCPGVELVAICDVDLARAQQIAAEHGVPHAYPSAARMLAGEQLDLVSVVSPDDCHRADAEAAIAAGAHVLCENPLAGSHADARALAVAAREAGVMTKVGFTMRYAPAMMRLHEIVTGGGIGTPRLLQAFQQNGQFLDPTTPFHWKMERARTGGGAIVEYGVHTIDLARWIMGEVGSVCATSRTWISERPAAGGAGMARVDVDDSTAWLMEFGNGAIGACHAGWATAGRPPGVELRVFGSEGAVRCALSDELPDAQGLWLAGPEGHFLPVDIPNRLSASMPEQGGWWFRFPAHLIQSFVTEIVANEVQGPTFDDGVAAQEILAAIQRSTEERRWVEVGGEP